MWQNMNQNIFEPFKIKQILMFRPKIHFILNFITAYAIEMFLIQLFQLFPY